MLTVHNCDMADMLRVQYARHQSDKRYWELTVANTCKITAHKKVICAKRRRIPRRSLIRNWIWDKCLQMAVCTTLIERCIAHWSPGRVVLQITTYSAIRTVRNSFSSTVTFVSCVHNTKNTILNKTNFWRKIARGKKFIEIVAQNSISLFVILIRKTNTMFL